MGIILSYLTGSPGRTDDPDPVTGLTSRDKYILTTTWTKLSTGPANVETGIAIFLKKVETMVSEDGHLRLSTIAKALNISEPSVLTILHDKVLISKVSASLFEKKPEYQQLFPFKDIPKDQLRNNSRFKAHCVTVMYGLSSIINTIDTPPVLEQLLLKQGVSHVPRNVPRVAYEELKQVLIDLFAQSMTQEQVATWGKFLDLGIAIMEKGADSVKKN